MTITPRVLEEITKLANLRRRSPLSFSIRDDLKHIALLAAEEAAREMLERVAAYLRHENMTMLAEVIEALPLSAGEDQWGAATDVARKHELSSDENGESDRAPQSAPHLLDAPAQIGASIFDKGCSWDSVILRAQNEYVYQQRAGNKAGTASASAGAGATERNRGLPNSIASSTARQPHNKED